jgi:predicted TIM-barrel fold metal-dependent hydrolase
MIDLIFSADSHLVEPPEIWDRVEPKYRDRVPKVVDTPPGQTLPGQYYVFEELKPIPVTNFMGAGHLHDPEKWAKFRTRGIEGAPKSFRDPSARLDEQDADGVDGEVIFPTMGMVVLAAKDDALKAACFRAVNSYVAEYCSVDRNRLIGVGVVSMHDLDTAVRDLEDAKKMGLQGVLITGSPGEGGFSSGHFDRFWAAAQDMEMPLTMHDLQVRGEVAFTGTHLNFFLLPMEIQAAFAEMIVGGMFDRFPRLQVVSAENDVGWLPHFVHRLTHFVTKIPVGHNLKRLPLQVVQENFWGSTQFENAAILQSASSIAPGRIMWGSDYPHPDSTYPNSRQWIAENSAGLSTELAAKIFGSNVTNLYKVDVQALKDRKKVAAAAA